MDLFNAVAGSVGIAGVLFSVWVWQRDRKRAAVEQQKAAEYQERIATMLSMANAAAKQTTLMTSIADRDDVTKKELKHLAVASLWTIEAIQRSLRRTRAVESQWKFGVPSRYEAIADDPPMPSEVPASAGSHADQIEADKHGI